MTTRGDAYRHPRDASQPMVGEQIAAARGLIALGTALLGCKEPPPEEKAANALNKMVDSAKQAVDDANKAVQDAVNK